MPTNNYQIAIDSSSEEEILADLKTLVTQNTNGAVDQFPDGAFHTAILETQAYQYRQLLRYLQYSPLFLVTGYLNDVLGLPKREGGRSVTAQITFTTPPTSTIRLYGDTVFTSEIGGTLLLNSDLVIPAGSSQVQAQLTVGSGTVSVGDFLALPNVLPLSSIVIVDADPGQTGAEADLLIEGWGAYLDRTANFLASTPQYTSDQVSSLLKVQGVTVTGIGQVDNGGFDICVLPQNVTIATQAVANLNQRYNKVAIRASEPIAVYPDRVGGKFTANELQRFNAAGQVARCDQPQGKSVFTVGETCYPRVERTVRYVAGDLVKISATGYKSVSTSGNLVTSIFGAAENGYGRLVRFDQFDPGTYTAGAGYRNGTSYYINTGAGYASGVKPADFTNTVTFVSGVAYVPGQVVVSGDWGLVVSQTITFPLTPTLVAASAPYSPGQGQTVAAGDYLKLFGKIYQADAAIPSYNYGNPLASLSEVYFHSQFIERPIFTRYPIGVFRGRYWDGANIQQQQVSVSDQEMVVADNILVASNSYSASVRPTFNEIDCDVPLVLPTCSYFVSP